MDPVVTTRSGKLGGAARPGVQVFRGIPYARAPRGALRWEAPMPPQSWQGVRDARASGPSAPQSAQVMLLIRRLIGASTRTQSQDCLYLNVWTPAADVRRRPVMVWIHGGGFLMGSGSVGLYSGAQLARTGDVVVVTINYRLGALGFLNLRECELGGATPPANLGLRDQIAALEWVRDNIEAFGGDPENVTVFGESAGGMSVGTLLGTPSAQGLFHRAIAQSGAAHNVSTRSQARRVGEIFLEELGARDRAALERASVSEILSAQQATTARADLLLGALPFQPSVDDDLIPTRPLEAIAKGLARHVPVLVGTNREEWRLFMLGDRRGRRLDEEGLRRRMARVLGGGNGEGRALAERALEVYGGAAGERRRGHWGDVWSAFQSDRIFHHPAHTLARLQSDHHPGTRAYLFSWSPPGPGRRIGACHGLEIPFVFGTLREPALRPLFALTRTARQLSAQMQRAWIAFARTGDPSHEELPDWPAYDGDGAATLELSSDPRLLHAPFAPALRFWSELAEAPTSGAGVAASARTRPHG